MAVSDSPPSSADEARNPVSQVIAPSTDDRKLESVKEASTSVFVNSEPIREEQVENAVKFLSHPKVKGSPVIYRRSFLERKGLSKEEIDEAFRRVPDPSPAVTATQPVGTAQDGKILSSPNTQYQQPSQVLQQTPVGNVGGSSRMSVLSRFHWYHAILALGFLAASGAGTAVFFKKSIIPRLKIWIRSVVLEKEEKREEHLVNKNSGIPSIAEETAAAAKAAAAAAADVARASQQMVVFQSEEKRCLEEIINMLNVQVGEMKSMNNAIQKLEDVAGQNNSGRTPTHVQDTQWIPKPSSMPLYSNGKLDTDSGAVRSMSPPAAVEPSSAPHPQTYMEIMDMVRRGEKPSNIRDINDAPPNPNQPVSNPRVAPRPKPWEVSQVQYNGLNGDDSVPYWQRKNVRITEIEADEQQKLGPQDVSVSEIPARKSWVPPQPPPVMMPEAAAAIRQPKKTAHQTEQLADELLLARSTKLSESTNSRNTNAESSDLNSTDVLEEENTLYFEA